MLLLLLLLLCSCCVVFVLLYCCCCVIVLCSCVVIVCVSLIKFNLLHVKSRLFSMQTKKKKNITEMRNPELDDDDLSDDPDLAGDDDEHPTRGDEEDYSQAA